jgi:hypothetical protein
LLEGGVAPSRVDRYLSELRDHLDDLVTEGLEAGRTNAAAIAEAAERLGSAEALCGAILDRDDALSWAARSPIAAYVCAPVAGLALLAALVMVALVAVCKAGSAGLSLNAPLPSWIAPFEAGAVQAVNLAMPLAAGWWLAWESSRRREGPLWPLLGLILLAASPLIRLTLSPPAVMGAPGEVGAEFDLLKSPRAVLGHVVANLAGMSALYLLLSHWRRLIRADAPAQSNS